MHGNGSGPPRRRGSPRLRCASRSSCSTKAEDLPARAQAVELLRVAAAKSETEGFANALLRDLGYRIELSSNL